MRRMGNSHSSVGCPFAVDTHCGTLCDARNKPCNGCDWEAEFPWCEHIAERCCGEGAVGCPCRTCEDCVCSACDETPSGNAREKGGEDAAD